MHKFNQAHLNASPIRRTALPACLLIVGLFSVSLLQPHPVHATDGQPATATRKTATATVYFIAPESGRLIGTQVLHPGDHLQLPAGFELLTPQVAANVQATLAQGYSTNTTLKIATRTTATIRYVDQAGDTVASTTLQGLTGTTGTFLPHAPAGYSLVDGRTRKLRFSQTQEDDLTIAITTNQAAKPAATKQTPSVRTTVPQAPARAATPAAPQAHQALPQQARLTFHYVVSGGNVERQIGSDTLIGPAGTRGEYRATIPFGYQLAPGQSQTVDYAFTNAPQTKLIHLVEAPAQAIAKAQVALATVVVIDDATGQIIATKAILGMTGERIQFDTASLIGPLMTGGTQRFEIHIRPGQQGDPFARRDPIPFTGGHAQQFSFNHQTPRQHLPNTDAEGLDELSGLPLDKLQPVIVTHSQLFPQAILNDGGGADVTSGLAAYFVALSGKINFGIRG